MNKKLYGVVFLTTLFILSSQVSACSATTNDDIEIVFEGGLGYTVTVYNGRDYEIYPELYVECIGLFSRPIQTTNWNVPPGWGLGPGAIRWTRGIFFKATVNVEEIEVEKKFIMIGLFVIFFK